MKLLPWIGVFFSGLVIGVLIGAFLVGRTGDGTATPSPTVTETLPAPTVTTEAVVTSTPAPASTAISASPPQGVQVDQVAPDFVLQDLTGQEVKLYDSRGKIVVLVFWKDGDADSLAMMPYLNEFYQEHKDDSDLSQLTINSGSLLDAVKPLAESNHWRFPILLDKGNQQSGEYAITFWPTTFFLDREGIIRDRVQGVLNSEKLNEHIDSLK